MLVLRFLTYEQDYEPFTKFYIITESFLRYQTILIYVQSQNQKPLI